jgi:hypothetical protein
MVNNKLIALVVVIAILFTGHVVDHGMRGDVPWPLTWTSLPALVVNGGIYVLIALGLVLYVHGRIGPGVWAIAAAVGLVFGWVGHFSPFTEQSPDYILGCYNSAAAGWLALGCLIALMAALTITLIYAGQLWIRQRKAGEGIA